MNRPYYYREYNSPRPTYDDVSKFGDWYDHITDWIVFIGVILVAVLRYQRQLQKNWRVLVPVIGCLILMEFVHFGCQQKLYGSALEETLNRVQGMCMGDAHQWSRVTKMFGAGTTMFSLLCVVLWLELHHQFIHGSLSVVHT